MYRQTILVNNPNSPQFFGDTVLCLNTHCNGDVSVNLPLGAGRSLEIYLDYEKGVFSIGEGTFCAEDKSPAHPFVVGWDELKNLQADSKGYRYSEEE